jgi:hypothetical protein
MLYIIRKLYFQNIIKNLTSGLLGQTWLFSLCLFLSSLTILNKGNILFKKSLLLLFISNITILFNSLIIYCFYENESQSHTRYFFVENINLHNDSYFINMIKTINVVYLISIIIIIFLTSINIIYDNTITNIVCMLNILYSLSKITEKNCLITKVYELLNNICFISISIYSIVINPNKNYGWIIILTWWYMLCMIRLILIKKYMKNIIPFVYIVSCCFLIYVLYDIILLR